MFTVKRLIIGIPLLVISCIAAQVVFSSKVTGDMVSAHWGSEWGSVDVIPADTVDARAYMISWQSCAPTTQPPDFNNRQCIFGSGLAPRSAIKVNRIEAIGLELSTSMLSVVFSSGALICSSGVCVPFTPPQPVTFTGTFTIYRGPGSYTEQSNGSTRREDILPFGGITSSQFFSGSRTRYSATFTGTVGPTIVVTPASGFNAQITVMKGQQSFETVYPPVP